MSYYSQPAAANYNSAPLHSQRQRGYRICDQCGTVETPAVKFRLCGGCMTTQYCSQDCQKVHWPSHRAICQHTASQVKQAASNAAHPDENITKYLRKFTSTHCALLGWAGFQALQLKRVPANVRQNALLIDLTYNSHADSNRRFSISSTHVVPRTYIRDPLVIADIQRREERCRQNGGIGTLVVIIQCGSTSQVMPVEVDPPSKIAWDIRDDWCQTLSHFVESGRTDFKPICTTSRGSV
ncbi:hypothetical protein JR316_0005594 [Psilocybe cubensis]|uniref:Uncharacterized protein n=2 Tax=Psilocybe cubensis TaxID=181762 RepID=A0ACB8GZ94_PSICU|nr:hypothetical protein JR316_0005594 [Psilocybe cubensis]KAH9481075.1 hypothetical protein JR316_0005594 [Psilocybe cubensis]